MLTYDLTSDLLLPIGARLRPDLFPFVWWHARRDQHIKVCLPQVAALEIRVVDGHIHTAPISRDLIDIRLWVHPADTLEFQDLLLEDAPSVLTSFLHFEIVAIHCTALGSIAHNLHLFELFVPTDVGVVDAVNWVRGQLHILN